MCSMKTIVFTFDGLLGDHKPFGFGFRFFVTGAGVVFFRLRLVSVSGSFNSIH